MKKIDLSGKWDYRTADSGEWRSGFTLPGSACENGVGKKQEYFDGLTKEAVRAPREKYEYIAPLYLRREIEIPAEWEDKCVSLFMERVNIASTVMIDGKKIARPVIELSAPHVYDLTGITAGRHELELVIDNRNLLNIDIMASGYSIDTQGYWNGVVGLIELRCEERTRLGNIRVYPDERGISVKITEISETYSPDSRTECGITLSVTDPNGRELGEASYIKTLYNSHQPDYYRYDIEAPMLWDEFEPNLYTLKVKLECGGITDEKSVRFGMRTISTKDKKILLNGRQISLRGTIDCAQFPLTGYPPTDKAEWAKRMMTVREYGLNHLRFHAWCPPEAAFAAADEAGVYISIEMPLWLNRDVCALEVGEDPIHRAYYPNEAVTISDNYGNHPSFIMFSNGNENMGDFELLERITIQTKAYDPRRIYTITSNFDHPLLPCEDYLCAFDAGGDHVRIQNMHDAAAKDTRLDYSEAVLKTPVPIISFEVGQYCSYPDVDICESYTGNLLPTNFDVIRREMQKKGVYGKLSDYIKASGDISVKLYKEDIEAALRTKDFGGIELLSLTDYTGQSTATVGILDVFGRNKGFISAKEWRGFCSEVVPLFKAKRIFKNTEPLTAELDLYDFGKTGIKKPLFEVRIYKGAELFYSEDTYERTLDIPLENIKTSALLNVEVTVEGHKNTWRVFVFADNHDTELHIVRTRAELDDIIKNGGRAVVGRELFDNAKDGSFIPVFWSPVHFPTPKPCGAMIDKEHPIFKSFPTDKYQDYQWKTLFENSRNMDINAFGHEVKPIIEIVPNFVDNTPASPLFETRIGKAQLLFCGFDLDMDDITVKCLKAAIAEYIYQ
ncbi:MAG: hypothetical protein IJH94_01140 [Clostridia bacterium]|nr:hypothetical protein [Clostridia bacterium]